MATNRDLLKEAIADAKTVKETAIANAKAALEEAFTPYLKEKLAAKLSEMEEAENEEMMNEETYEAEMDEVKKPSTMDEEISLDELLAELEEEDTMDETGLYEAKKEEKEEEEMSIEDMSEDDLKSFIEDVIKDMVAAGELEAGHEGEEGEEAEEEAEMEPAEGEEEAEESEEELDEEVNIDELLSEDLEEEMDEVNLDELLAELEETDSKKEEKELDEAKEEESMKKDLEEAYTTIKTLKSELQEINLLNAKLLYTNKIFRNKSLTESQKIKVLTAFDKATSKKEAQLVYETLLENFKTSTTKNPIKESLNPASKILGNVQAKPIIESNDAFARMRELAGLHKK